MKSVKNPKLEAFILGYFDNLEKKLKIFPPNDYIIGALKGSITSKTIFKDAMEDADYDFTKAVFYTKNRLQKILIDIKSEESNAYYLGLKYSISSILANFIDFCEMFAEDFQPNQEFKRKY
ncbi:MAG: hypothetical protein QXV17_14260 [Candidatus Micrarchaeaceae archaeon]